MYILTWGYRHGIYNHYINRRAIYTQMQNEKTRKTQQSWNWIHTKCYQKHQKPYVLPMVTESNSPLKKVAPALFIRSPEKDTDMI